MHRDHKLGLALGVLVVGFAAALCFPKQTDVDQRLLQLDNTAELDADIAQLPVHAYTDADLPAAARPAAPDPAPAPVTQFGPVASVPGNGEFDLLAGPPAPITPAGITPMDTAANDLDHESPAVAADADSVIPHSPRIDGAGSTGASQYVVQPGDTLSSLATEFLGHQGRYLELFEANREVLATPDDLQPGMVLNVPGVDAITERVVLEAEPATVEPTVVITNIDAQPVSEAPPAAATATTPGERPRLFRPVRSQPFLKAQPVSRGSGAPLPTMDASPNARDANDASALAPETYTVRPGDTLEGIAVRTYGDARRVQDLLKANQKTVSNPRRLRPGMKLTLPAIP